MKKIIGVPREIKPREMRVAMAPDGVRRLTEQGFQVLVQKGAGAASGFSDRDYAAAGALMVPDARALYGQSEVVVKVKEPQPAEFPLLQAKHVLFCYLHLASPQNAALVQALVDSRCTAIAFETLEDEGRIPLLKPMSEIAGGLAASFAAYLESVMISEPDAFRLPEDAGEVFGRIARNFPEVPGEFKMGRTVIWGGGVAGGKALEFAMKMGASAVLVELNPERRRSLTEIWGKTGRFEAAAPGDLKESVLAGASVLIGCVHQAGARAFQVMDAGTLARISAVRRKVIIDVAIDQGGNFPEARAATYENPVYLDSRGNVRFSVANMPSLCGPYASTALTETALPYLMLLAEDFEAARRTPPVRTGINVANGLILNEAVKSACAA